MLRRQQTVYVAVDPFFSPRGRVLHRFDEFLAGLADAQIPCVWLTSATRAQLDEPRRRLGQSDPYIGENGCGVYLPEDYFHLKSKRTVRMGRYTCIPIAKPQPAAAEALDELATDLDVSVVPLRSLSPRELSQNTGLPPKEAELVRMRDFDELFFFAGASEEEIAKFAMEAKARSLVFQRAGAFWSLSCGGDLAACIRELGELYDRASHAHALRIGVTLAPAAEPEPGSSTAQRFPAAAVDRMLFVTERMEHVGQPEHTVSQQNNPRDERGSRGQSHSHSHFHLHAPGVWEELLATIASKP
jgi:predicted mannosyl-3-phosphoglycerate phosphatase (HAD superfamily)